jgi:DNA polymerase-3 subunit delta'
LPPVFGYKRGMALREFQDQHRGVELLQRSLGRGRLGHAYLFAGEDLQFLEQVARNLAKVINCAEAKPTRGITDAVDSCDVCSPCRRIDSGAHPDVLWIRPESKSRVITIDQIRDVLHVVSLKPTEADTKVAVLVDADRMNPQAANAFLKTLEEPPGNAVLILVSTQPQNLLETILSRCLFLRFGGDERRLPECVQAWLAGFCEEMTQVAGGVLPRYTMLQRWLGELGSLRARVEDSIRARSPLEQHDDIEPKLREKWENELKAAAESEYRRLRRDYLTGLQWYFRDVWVQTLGVGSEVLALATLADQSKLVSTRLVARDAHVNVQLLARTQRLLETNLQEALVLEVMFLRLRI